MTRRLRALVGLALATQIFTAAADDTKATLVLPNGKEVIFSII